MVLWGEGKNRPVSSLDHTNRFEIFTVELMIMSLRDIIFVYDHRY